MTQPTSTISTPDTHLTRSDRCDRCGAQAFIRVVLPAGGELLFCSHHGRQYEGKLRELAAVIVDETELLQD
jgi:hypothetical protein